LRHALAIGDETWRNIVTEDTTGLFPHVVHFESNEAFLATCSKPIEELHPDVINRAKDREMMGVTNG
jgi:hypothetical protein